MYEKLDMGEWMIAWNSVNNGKEKHYLLWKLFKFQIKRLEHLNLDCIIADKESTLDKRSIYRLSKMQHKVLAEAMQTGKPETIPFIPVLPRKIKKTFDVVMNLHRSGEKWIPSINLNKVDMGKETSPHLVPYFIFNISLGTGPIDVSPGTAREDMISRGLHPVNLAEALALQIHTGILDSFSIHACGSTYRENKKSLPGLYKDGEQLALGWSSWEELKHGYICPSYEYDMRAISWRGVISPKAWIKFNNRPPKRRE